MEADFRISGYPLSQLAMNGFIAAACGAPVVILWLMGSPVPLAVWLLAISVVAICLAAILANPLVTITIDAEKVSMEIKWISFGGLRCRRKTLRVSDVQKIVYGVTTLHTKYRRKRSSLSWHSFYAQMSDGSHEYLSPKTKATPGLSRKLGRAVSQFLGVPFVQRRTGSGRFVEEPVT